MGRDLQLAELRDPELRAALGADQVDVQDTASWDQGGYVLGAYQAFGVKGWRKSLNRVAAFYFTALPDSYAARTGRPGNVGVIGVALFRKKPEPVVQYTPQPRPSRSAAEAEAPATVATDHGSAGPARDDLAGAGAGSRAEAPAAAQKSARLGTGHGRSEESQVTLTEFERATGTPAEIITIYYDSYRNLVAQGVIRASVIARPDPFPARFAPDPR